MKALSIDPEYTMYIFNEHKNIECRTWKTNYRGPLLICAMKTPVPGCISGHAYFTVELTDIEEFNESHLDGAMMEEVPDVKCYAWKLENVEPIFPIKVRGKMGLFDVDDSLIKYFVDSLPEDCSDEECERLAAEFDEKYIAPITYMPDMLEGIEDMIGDNLTNRP